jgi:hypothetical protein
MKQELQLLLEQLNLPHPTVNCLNALQSKCEVLQKIQTGADARSNSRCEPIPSSQTQTEHASKCQHLLSLQIKLTV